MQRKLFSSSRGLLWEAAQLTGLAGPAPSVTPATEEKSGRCRTRTLLTEAVDHLARLKTKRTPVSDCRQKKPQLAALQGRQCRRCSAERPAQERAPPGKAARPVRPPLRGCGARSIGAPATRGSAPASHRGLPPRYRPAGPGAPPRTPGGSRGSAALPPHPADPSWTRGRQRGAAAARGQRDSRSKLRDLAEAAAWGGWCRGEGSASHLQPLMTFLEIVSPPPWQPRTRRRGGQGRGCAGGGQGHATGGAQ